MNYTINVYKTFKKEFKQLSKRYHSLESDVLCLSKDLMENPEMGVDLGGGVHKVRIAIASKGKGKSGGARVITMIVCISEEEKEIGLHYIYDKSERESITDKELQDILRRNNVL